ncbi:MAG: hypothetical protein ACKVRP_06725 [Bacteroidota bacterium]
MNRIETEFHFYYMGVVDGTLPGPYAYRLLLPQMVYRVGTITGVSPLTIDFAFKVILLFFSQLLFFGFMKRFVPEGWSFAAVFLLDVLIAFSLSYIEGPSVLETGDLANMLVFIIALSALHQGQWITLCIVLFIGMFNRESPIVLIPLVVYLQWGKQGGWQKILFVLLSCVVPYAVLHTFIHPSTTVWFTTEGLARNIPFVASEYLSSTLVANLRLFLLIGPLMVLTLHVYRQLPAFLRATLLVVPLLIPIHYVFGVIIETRLWMPLFPILVPTAILGLEYIYKKTETRNT